MSESSKESDSSGEKNILKNSIIEKLFEHCNYNEKTAIKISRIFSENYKKYLIDLKNFIEKKDLDEIIKTAHKCKGAVAVFGESNAYKIISEIENNGKTNNLVNTESLLAQLNLEMINIVNVLQNGKLI